jgi:hypothetical protein
MSDFNLTTSVAFIIFNRPETTEKVFEAIKQAKPKKLFIIADGPRSDKPGENEKCLKTRAITNNIDWDCEVFRNYSETNLGCRKRVSSGLDWLFENVEEAIILEDDCLPHPSFFRFCQELLTLYRDNKNIMIVSGNKVLYDYQINESSYYFSDYLHIWGWATWRRAWNHFDLEMKDWDINKSDDFLNEHLHYKPTIKFWKTIIQEVYDRKIDTWDCQLQYASWKHKSLAIIPAKNLVVNLGFGFEATNTTGSGGLYEKMKFQSINFPLIHPKIIEPNTYADNLENKLFHKFGFKEKIRRVLLKLGIKIK